MSFPSYSKYKASGVEWLGDVPEKWGTFPLKYLATIKTGYAFSSDDFVGEGIPVLRIGDITTGGTIDFSSARYLPNEYGAKHPDVLAIKGDIVMAMTGATIGKAGRYLEEQPALLNQRVCIFRSTQINSQHYLWYILNTGFYAKHISLAAVGGAQPNISDSELLRCGVPVPPLAEQVAIATFLDLETAKIDGLIAEQRRLMELLKEKRQAVISHAVTKGLDPNAKMKPSGVEWLGDVPEHWEIRRIANVFYEVSESGNDELPILSVSIHHGVSDKEIDEEDLDRKVTRSDDRSKYKKVSIGDLVYNMMRAWQGGFGTVTVEGMVSPAYVVARPKVNLITAYIEHLLRTPQAIEQMRRHSRGITDFRLRLYWDEFKNIHIALPTEKEAQEICTKIAQMDQSFDTLTAEAQRAIDLLQERRTALISAAVTGQIDVRNINTKETA